MTQFGKNHHNWNGGISNHTEGYIQILNRDHPRADNRGYVFEHMLVVENILGKSLPPKACVHHINKNRKDNRPENLVVCENNAYHKLLHQRTRAFMACGNANKRKCKYCHQYDLVDNLKISDTSGVFHRQCNIDYCNKRRERLKTNE